MKSVEDEFREIDRVGDWARLFQLIKTESSNYDYSYKDARKSENKNLNRYRDVSPYDHSRVKLLGGNCDYINASLVQVPQARRSYILAQGPLPHTASHFWQMTWEQNSTAILMLNKVIEKNQIKCHQYWPLGKRNGGEDEMVFKDVRLKVQLYGEDEKSFYTLRRLKVTHLETQEARLVFHFHYTTWPDFGVPESPWEFLIFLLVVRNAGVLDENVGPPIVHCSAGIGRSGTFCLVDSCLVLIEQTRDANSINIKEVLMDMRKYRMGLIQTPDQLRFSYLAIIEGGKRILSKTFTENALINEELNKNRSPDQRRSSHDQRRNALDQRQSSAEHYNVDRRHSALDDRGESSSPHREIRVSTEGRRPSTESRRPSTESRRPSTESRRSSLDKTRTRSNPSPPPPLPPRRLKDDTTAFESDPNNCVHNYSNDFKLSSLDTVLSDAETRRRVRRERNVKTSERIEQMKQRQHESETWQKRRSSMQTSGSSPDIPPKRRRSFSSFRPF